MNNRVLFPALALSATLLLAGCAQTEKIAEEADEEEKAAITAVETTGDKASYEAAMAAAEAARKKASSVGGEWRDVGDILKEAAKAAAEGNYGKATGLAEIARTQSELGYEQITSQKGAGNPPYLSN